MLEWHEPEQANLRRTRVRVPGNGPLNICREPGTSLPGFGLRGAEFATLD